MCNVFMCTPVTFKKKEEGGRRRKRSNNEKKKIDIKKRLRTRDIDRVINPSSMAAGTPSVRC